MYKNPIFQNRYRITGTLTASSPLHVGDGDSLSIRARKCTFPPDQLDTEFSTFVLDCNGRAVIPGSTLKGVLFAWLTRKGVSEKLLKEVFGTQERGGKAEFHDARLTQPATGGNTYRWWDERRGTCLAPGVSLDPKTRTAKEHLLYYTEFVPEGSQFQVTVTGQNLTEEERDLILFALDAGFREADDLVRVGAEGADGWGAMKWGHAVCSVIEPADVQTWLGKGAAHSYEELFREVKVHPKPLPVKAPAPALVLEVRLRFQGAMLVNDPSQARKRDEKANEPGVGHAAARRKNDQFFLPGSAVRGALRSQARRIWQTLADGKAGDVDAADHVEAKSRGDVKKMAAFYRMFGAPGWRSPIAVPDFEIFGAPRLHRQEFVAVDRFTGGAADQKKFTAQALYAPELRGVLRVDLTAWRRAAVDGWALLLFLFLLRDLQEGDVGFGFGGSKGYGSCVADIQVRTVGEIPGELGGKALEALVRGVVKRDAAALEDPRLPKWEEDLLKLTATAA